MEIQGKVTNILPMHSGVSARGEWKSQEFVITTEEQYPKMVCFQVFGEDKINSFALQIGEVVKVSFDISAHEYQGRFFNSVNAWKVEKLMPIAQNPPLNPQQNANAPAGSYIPPQTGGYVPPQAGGNAMLGGGTPPGNSQNPIQAGQQAQQQGGGGDLPF
nr:MAG TPA: SINGLE STRANDED DNA BINDING PROTEIN/RNA BARREL, PROTEIN-DNA COMPLEX, REPLICATION-RNA.2A [Caudoviricetes sp.]